MKPFLCMALLTLAFPILAQDLPTDFLTADFHKGRREELRKKMPPHSMAVFFSNPVRNRANDVDYTYHQDPDFFYLTGYREPNAVLLLFKENQSGPNGVPYNEIIFVQQRDAFKEMWNGRRLGTEGTKDNLGLKQAFNGIDFKKYNLNFSSFNPILFYDFKNDVRDNPLDSADLYDLIEQFKMKVGYPRANAIALEKTSNNLNTKLLASYMNDLRGIKTKEELELIRKAVKISCAGQVETFKAIKPGMSEREIQGIHEFVFKKYEAEEVGYPSIVGGGHNGCILHYIENYKPDLSPKELILMDLGAEYHGYTADITRTIPVGGKFSPEQKLVYNLVLQAQEVGMKSCRDGASFQQLNENIRKYINRGLKELNIIPNENTDHTYYPHGCCHHIGLDVHDRGSRNELKENMVITIEPGIYIPENSPCDKKWWGIAVRIEDDYLIQKTGCEHLSASAPRKPEEIEALMLQPSALDDFTLPDLDKK